MIKKTMTKRVLLVIALLLFTVPNVAAKEIRMPTFSFNQPKGWKTTLRERHRIQIAKLLHHRSTSVILFDSNKSPESEGKTLKEMLPYTLGLVKRTNKRFRDYLLSNNTSIPNLPLLRDVVEVGTSLAKIGHFECILSSLLLMPMDTKAVPIAFLSMTSIGNGRRYNITVTIQSNDIKVVHELLGESFKIIETYKTFQNGITPI